MRNAHRLVWPLALGTAIAATSAEAMAQGGVTVGAPRAAAVARANAIDANAARLYEAGAYAQAVPLGE